MTAPVRPRTSSPSTSLPPTLVVGDNLQGHHVGDPPFYFNGVQGILQAGSTPGELYFVPVAAGPPVPQSQIYTPPDVNTAWQSFLWAIGSGLPDGLNAAKIAARGIRSVR